MDNIEVQIDTIIENTIQNLNILNEEQNTHLNTDEEIENGTKIDSINVEVFNIALHQYLQIQEEIKALLEAIKIRNKKKRQLTESLASYLKENQIVNVNLGGSYKGKKLESKITYSNKGFTKQAVTESIYNELKEQEELFEKIMESIGSKNTITEKWNLKIVNEKKNSSGKTKIERAKTKIDMAEELLNDEE